MTTFTELGLSDKLLAVVHACGYQNPTPIQEKSIPIILTGRDVLGSAQTGTGKTAAFALPIIDILASGRAKARMARSLILTPTRELAAQISEQFGQFSKQHNLTTALLIGGEDVHKQTAILARGVDVLIATPGRLLDHFERGNIMLREIKILVIDEADRMLDMGFIPDVKQIAGALPKIRQTLFFSATLDETIYGISEHFVINPKIIEISPEFATADTVEQFTYQSAPRKKHTHLCEIITKENVTNAFIFCNMKRAISGVKKALERHGLDAEALHGDMTQSARNAALARFKNNETRLLVASDVAARGLDIAKVSHVFNFDIPNNPEDYVHRIGRTGRAGNKGRAFTLLATDDDALALAAVEARIGKTIPKYQGSPASSPDANKAAPASTSAPAPALKNTAKTSKKTPNRNTASERKSPPDCSGNRFADSEHTPAFLLN